MVADSGLRMNRPGLKVFSKQSMQRQKQVFRTIHGASQVALPVKNQLANGGDIRDASSSPGSGRAPGEGRGNPLFSVLAGESHGWRSLVSYSP